MKLFNNAGCGPSEGPYVRLTATASKVGFRPVCGREPWEQEPPESCLGPPDTVSRELTAASYQHLWMFWRGLALAPALLLSEAG